jgi:hypothetical protein
MNLCSSGCLLESFVLTRGLSAVSLLLRSCLQIYVLYSICFPLQGFFNFIIFIRPRYSGLRRNFPQNTRWWALWQAVWSPTSHPHQNREGRTRAIARSRSPRDIDRAPEALYPGSTERADVTQSKEEVNPIADTSHNSWDDACNQPTELGQVEDTFPRVSSVSTLDGTGKPTSTPPGQVLTGGQDACENTHPPGDDARASVSNS